LLPILGMERSFFVIAAAYGGVGALTAPGAAPPPGAKGASPPPAAGPPIAPVAFSFGLMARTFFGRSGLTSTADGCADLHARAKAPAKRSSCSRSRGSGNLFIIGW